MKILGIDTSTVACSVSLLNNEQLISKFELQPRKQAQLILPLIDQILKESSLKLSELDAIAVTVGPGSFVGLRIGISIAQGLAFAYSLPVIPVSTLATMAQGAYRQYQAKCTIVALDAHMEEIYLGVYEIKHHLAIAIQPDQLCLPSKVRIQNAPWFVVGDAWNVYHTDLLSSINPQQMVADFYPHAQDLLTLAKEAYLANNMLAVENLQPNYLRGTEAWRT
ncbi:MAG: tRNA (adenosine(37)-N6)-threonylcarbamoyltransferase complex dimerization subunit type 1 TsaB [Gammaproteobacteria bacterium RIFCSPHIGHO2_12_FULL_35_23]|nr:MAG: tRNA (adenosine(37)-N6)-threonylcarbamoyltransferase complex dimerization subunit type 1 TsaB [Gammaproteobacteria bacterium RIFCSPHIGHO2_12_FULL_35_23]